MHLTEITSDMKFNRMLLGCFVLAAVVTMASTARAPNVGPEPRKILEEGE